MKLDYLIRGTPGHPVHPPLTDATIGIYTFATIAAVLDVLGIAEDSAAQGLVRSRSSSASSSPPPTAITGVVDWLKISPGTPLKRTATSHLIAMVAATVFFLITALVGYGDGMDGVVEPGAADPESDRVRPAHAGRLARRRDRLHLRHARARPGRGTGAPGGVTGSPPEEEAAEK